MKTFYDLRMADAEKEFSEKYTKKDDEDYHFNYNKIFRMYNARYFNMISMHDYVEGWKKLVIRMEKNK